MLAPHTTQQTVASIAISANGSNIQLRIALEELREPTLSLLVICLNMLLQLRGWYCSRTTTILYNGTLISLKILLIAQRNDFKKHMNRIDGIILEMVLRYHHQCIHYLSGIVLAGLAPLNSTVTLN